MIALTAGIGITLTAFFLAGNRGPSEASNSTRKDPQTTLAQTPPTRQAASPSGTSSTGTDLMPPFEITSWSLPAANTTPLAPGETFASRQVRAIGQVTPGSLPALSGLHEGQRLQFPIRNAASATGIIQLKVNDEEGWVRIGGKLEGDTPGSFSLSQKGSEWHGRVRLTASGTAYVLESSANGGLQWIEKPLSSIQCAAIPRRPNPNPGDAAVQQGAPEPVEAASLTVPELDSLPAATHVIYIDFDGEVVTDPDWNSGFTINAVPSRIGSATITAATMTDIWKRVAEDFKPYQISVTTIPGRYTAAGAGKRMRCIVTPTDVAEPGAGGVAYLGSYDQAGSGFSATIPCWAFTESYYNANDIAGIISHEVGHTFGLSHDGKYPDSDSRHIEYYEGHGSGATSWGPLMGTTYDRTISQWSKGEYANASNTENDLSIIGNSANGFFLRADDALDGLPGTPLPNTGVFDQTGIIDSEGDTDLYAFSSGGGTVTVSAASAAVSPNLDILLELREADGVTVLKSANPAGPAKATLTQTVSAGNFTIAIRGTGSGTASTGYTAYGSIGEYTLSGTFPALPDVAPVITSQPLDQTVALGAKASFSVAATSNNAIAFQWTKDGVPLPGQTKSTLTIAKTAISHQGVYRCILTNAIGPTVSDPATLALEYKPVFTQHPIKQSTQAGNPVIFSANSDGTPTVAYQWQLNGVDIPGATSSALMLTNPQWADIGSYRCIASNAFGTTVSKTATLTVNSAPVILVQPPAAALVPLNGSATLSLTAAGTGTLSYQWFQGLTKLVGKTSRTLSLTRISLATAGIYHCQVKNTLGTTVSADCIVTVQDSPVIVTDPASVTVARGKRTTLSVAAVGSPALKYEWRKDGLKVGASASRLSVLATADADYLVIVTNTFGAATSAVAHVTVHDVPKIATQPLSQIKAYGGSVDFTAAATGTPPFAYQWKRNNVPLTDENSPTLSLSGLTAADAGRYSCTVSNDVGSVTSKTASLVLQTAPAITQQPLSATVDAFASITFAAAGSGSATLKYQWQKDGIDIPKATAKTYKIVSVQPGDAGSYRLRITNRVGTAMSDPAILAVNPVAAPSISDFTPKIGKAGHYVRVLGSNFNWTTAVNFRKATGTLVKAAFVIVSPTELLVTVPAGASSSEIEVTGRGGNASTGAFFNVTTVNDTNDDFLDARVIPAAGGKVSGNNSAFSSQPGEPEHAADALFPGDYVPVYSAWFQWTPTVSGSYYLTTRGSKFDTRIGVYTGNSVNALSTVGFNDDEDWENFIVTSKAYVVVDAGTTYYIAVDGFNYIDFGFSYDESGAYTLSITRIASTTVLATAGHEPWSVQDVPAPAPGSSITLGGNSATVPALAWIHGGTAGDATLIHGHASVSYESSPGCEDQFGLIAYDSEETPLFGLNIAGEDGGLTLLDNESQSKNTGQTLLPGQMYELDFELDRATRTWSATLNGIWICRDLPLPGTSDFADLAAQWLPGSATHSHASFTVHSAEITVGRTEP